jgi:hypothetical protein
MNNFAEIAADMTKDSGWGNTATSIGLGLLGGPVGWGLAGLHAAGSYGLLGNRVQRWLGGSDEPAKMPKMEYAANKPGVTPAAKPTPAAAKPAPATTAAAAPVCRQSAERCAVGTAGKH